MPNVTQAEYEALLARRQKQEPAKPSRDDVREAELHQQILDECKRRGWVAFHSRTDKRTTATVGMPDFVIFGKRVRYGDAGHFSVGHTIIECKVGSRKLTPEQLAIKVQLESLGHCYYVVRSFEEFLEVV